MGITLIDTSSTLALHSVAATRAIEMQRKASLAPQELMERAGASVASLARAIAPHARRIWVACGPGNNGGDGLVAARLLHEALHLAGKSVQLHVTLTSTPTELSQEAESALQSALLAGLTMAPTPPEQADLVIDALLGIGARETPRGLLGQHLARIHQTPCPVLAVDLPSALMADTGAYLGPGELNAEHPRHTLSLLTLKPGLFTASGKDLVGTLWFDPLMPRTGPPPVEPATAFLVGRTLSLRRRPHTAHKGVQGDVVVIGGQAPELERAGMIGAAMLAARAALHAGAGRVYLGLLGQPPQVPLWDPAFPELMLQSAQNLCNNSTLLKSAVVVCGCGGGQAIEALLPGLLELTHTLILDADALNHVATDKTLRQRLKQRQSRGLCSVITPHPLEAARLLGCDTPSVMADRIAAARALSELLGAVCVLKGSGTVIVAPGQTPYINSSGNPALATAGTGDVLAGWMGATLAAGRYRNQAPLDSVLDAVFLHGLAADQWSSQSAPALTASRLASLASYPAMQHH